MRRLSVVVAVLAGMLEGGSVWAFPITIDATKLSGSHLLLYPVGPSFYVPVNFSASQTLDLPPGSYGTLVGSAQSSFGFSVDSAGKVQYPSTQDGFLSGRGTSTLIVKGYPFSVDATALSGNAFLIPPVWGLSGEGGRFFDSKSVQTFTLAPAVGYQFQQAWGELGDFSWGIDPLTGLISYDPAFDTFLGGRGTNTLRVRGFPISIDATKHAFCGDASFIVEVFGLGATQGNGTGPLSAGTVQPLRLVPDALFYEFFQPNPLTGLALGFRVRRDGLLDLFGFPRGPEAGPTLPASALLPCVSGEGTSVMTVACNPFTKAQDLVAQLEKFVSSLPASAFRDGNAKLGNALVNKLEAVGKQISAQGSPYTGALANLRNDILPKATDWIVDPAAQTKMTCLLDELIAHLAAS